MYESSDPVDDLMGEYLTVFPEGRSIHEIFEALGNVSATDEKMLEQRIGQLLVNDIACFGRTLESMQPKDRRAAIFVMIERMSSLLMLLDRGCQSYRQ